MLNRFFFSYQSKNYEFQPNFQTQAYLLHDLQFSEHTHSSNCGKLLGPKDQFSLTRITDVSLLTNDETKLRMFLAGLVLHDEDFKSEIEILVKEVILEESHAFRMQCVLAKPRFHLN